MAQQQVPKTVRSNSVAFVDLTDAKKIDVYITSNLPTSQIYDKNQDTYSPDWRTSNLELKPTVYLDGENITNNNDVVFTWYRKVGSNDKVLIQIGKDLTIISNELNNPDIGTSNIGVVSYICSVKYKNEKDSENQITFARVDTGKDGTSGNSAPAVQAQYSADGNTNWSATFDPNTHKYIHFSYDNGATWSKPAIKIAGEDGTSVNIKGTAYYNGTLTNSNVGKNISIYSSTTFESNTMLNKTNYPSIDDNYAYIVSSYLCVYDPINDNFICTGQITGPKGETGDSSYIFIRYANDANGKDMSASSDGKSYIGFYRTTVNKIPTDTSSATWGWKKFVGEDAKSITLTASSQAFKTNKNGIMSPSTITVTAQTVNTTIPSGGWKYSTDGGQNFSATAAGVVQSGNKVTITGVSLATNSLTIKAEDGIYSDVITVYKVSDGVDGSSGTDGESTSIAFLNNENISFVADANGQIKERMSFNINVVGYEGTTKVVPQIDELGNIPDGMIIGEPSQTEITSELQIPITIEANTTLGSTASTNGTIDIPITYPVHTTLKLTWSKINTGPKGDNAPAVKARYSVDGSTGWSSVFNVSTHKYVQFSYDDGKTWSAAIKMVGDDAKSIILNADAQVFKIDKSKAITPTTIIITAQTVNTSINGWTYSTDGGKTFSSTAPTGVTRSGNSITVVGSTLASNSLVVRASDGTYSDTLTIFKALDGVDGTAGADAPIAFLSNENIGFSANAQGQVSDTLFTTNVVGYKGTTKVVPTIGTITGLPTGVTYNGATTSSNELVLSFSIANNSTLGYATSANGTITIPVTSPVNTNLKLSWSKINSGAGVESTTVSYGISDSSSTQPTEWQQTIPTVAEGKYLWTRTIIDYTDEKIPDTVTYTYTKQGVKGDTGSSGSSVTVTSIQYKEGSSATTAPTGTWSDSVVSVSEGKYLWTKTDFSDGKTAYGVAKQGVSGKDGVGINSTTVDYGVSDSATVKPTTWQQDIPTVAEGKYLWTRTIIDYTDTSKADTVTYVYAKQGSKGDTGTAGTSVTVKSIKYQAGTSATTAPTGTWSDSVVTVSEGNYLWTQTTFSDNKVAYGVAKQGQKGDTGRGISKITEYYLATTSSSGVTTATTGWTPTVQTIDVEKKYLWNYELITYTDGATSPTTPVIIGVFGSTGATGKGISSVAEHYLATASSSGVTTSTTGWTPEIQTLTAIKKYLWNYEIITYTDGTTSTINPVIIGVYGDKGDKGDVGRGVTSIVEQYYQSTSATSQTGGSWSATVPTWTDGKYIWTRSVITYTDSTTSTTSPICITGQKGGTGVGVSSVDVWYYQSTSATALSGGSWSTTAPAWSDGKYIWTKTITTYTNSTTDETTAVCITGQKGSKGNDAYTVMLTNESHIFAGDVSNAIVGSATTQVLAYNGSTAQTVTIVSVNSKTAATTDTDTGIAGLKFKCSALSGASPTITFTCTTSFVSKSGTIPIVLSVGGVSFTKMFTYSIAFKGTTGSPGNPGSPGTPASLVDITPSALYFKSTTGKGGTFTPDYIYLYPRFQTVAYSKWEYSTNGGTSWTTVTSGSNGLTIGTYNSVAYSLQIAKSSALYTDTVTSISFRCVSSNTAVYDTVSIAKIYDVVDLQIGGRNLVLASNVPYSNSEYRVASYNMSEDWELNTTYTLTLKGTIDAGRIFGVWANGSGTRVATLTYDVTKDLYISTFTTPASIANQTPKVINIYNTPSTTVGNASIEWIKLEKGNKETDWSPAPEDLNNITFQIYAPNGYLLTNDLQSLTLETFAYEGSIEITSGATFQWSHLVDDAWVAISGATKTTLTVTKSDVLRAKTYRCVMTYKSKEYVSTITVQDKTDTYNSIMCLSSNVKGGECYWVLYTLVYSDTGEIDPLLGPISINAPSSPVNGDYWYAVDSTNATVQLKKYNDTTWVNSTDKQLLTYLWNIVNDGSSKTPIGGANKVQVISCNDFTATATLVCDVSNETDGVLTQSSLSITDASDPIVSSTEPTNAVDGQIWIKPNTNGAYNMFLWSEATKKWIPNDMDTRNKVHTSKPSSYNKGDIWITESDNIHSVYKKAGTLLQALKDNTTYSESDWSATLKYDKDIAEINGTLSSLSQYVDITSLGLRIGAVDSNKELSPFTALFTSTELAFYQHSEKLLTLSNNQLTAPRVVVEEDLEVDGTISLGSLQLMIESNGSFSFSVTK